MKRSGLPSVAVPPAKRRRGETDSGREETITMIAALTMMLVTVLTGAHWGGRNDW